MHDDDHGNDNNDDSNNYIDNDSDDNDDGDDDDHSRGIVYSQKSDNILFYMKTRWRDPPHDWKFSTKRLNWEKNGK